MYNWEEQSGAGLRDSWNQEPEDPSLFLSLGLSLFSLDIRLFPAGWPPSGSWTRLWEIQAHTLTAGGGMSLFSQLQFDNFWDRTLIIQVWITNPHFGSVIVVKGEVLWMLAQISCPLSGQKRKAVSWTGMPVWVSKVTLDHSRLNLPWRSVTGTVSPSRGACPSQGFPLSCLCLSSSSSRSVLSAITYPITIIHVCSVPGFMLLVNNHRHCPWPHGDCSLVVTPGIM